MRELRPIPIASTRLLEQSLRGPEPKKSARRCWAGCGLAAASFLLGCDVLEFGARIEDGGNTEPGGSNPGTDPACIKENHCWDFSQNNNSVEQLRIDKWNIGSCWDVAEKVQDASISNSLYIKECSSPVKIDNSSIIMPPIDCSKSNAVTLKVWQNIKISAVDVFANIYYNENSSPIQSAHVQTGELISQKLPCSSSGKINIIFRDMTGPSSGTVKGSWAIQKIEIFTQ